MTRAARVSIAVVLALAAWSGVVGAQQPPDLRGIWRLDRSRSDDAIARVDQAAGPGQVKSGGATGLKILPEGNTRSEVERVELRDWMMGLAGQVGRLEIEQTGEEIKLSLGEDADTVRIFYLTREHVRQDAQGRKLKCRALLEADKLVLEEVGENGWKLAEVLTPVPANGWLTHAVRFEHPLLKQPLSLRLLYVKESK
jgi:hypothetical protein